MITQSREKIDVWVIVERHNDNEPELYDKFKYLVLLVVMPTAYRYE